MQRRSSEAACAGEAGRVLRHDGFCGTAVVGRAGARRRCGRRGLGAGGDEGEDRQFNAVVVHLREPFGVDIE